MESSKSDLKEYVAQLLELYLHTPGTLGRVRREDRRFAAELHARNVPLLTVREALLLAAARRCLRAPEAPPLNPVRSLHYFAPVVEEVLAKPLPAGYPEYLHLLRSALQGLQKKIYTENRFEITRESSYSRPGRVFLERRTIFHVICWRRIIRSRGQRTRSR